MRVSIPSRAAVIARHRARGGGVAAVLPIVYPRALFRAHGLLPVEVWGPPGVDSGLGAAHLQAYVCSIARNALSFVLSDELLSADIVVVPHTCDSLQGLGSVLLDVARPQVPVAPLYLPRTTGPAAVEFLAAELRVLGARLSECTGRSPTDAELLSCVEREAAADAKLAALWRARPGIALGDRDLYRLVRSREYLPAEDFATLADAALSDAGPAPVADRVGLVLSGLVPEPMGLLDVIEEAGARVLADDMACSGRRLYPAGQSAEPCTRMAERLLGGPPDSTRGSSMADRARHLIDLAQRSGARAVLFSLVKFCEPELFYLPRLRRRLDEAGLKSLVLELDIGDALPYQAITRIEALVESLQEDAR